MSKNVFLADITHIEVITPGDPFSYPGRTRGYFHIKETFKGSAENIPYFSASEFPSTMCSMNVKQGASYYVFAEEDGPIDYYMCSLTTLAEHKPYYTEVLRKLKSNEETKTFSGVYISDTDSLITQSKARSTEVIGMNLYEHEKYNVQFTGYMLNDGRIYAIKTISSESID